MLFLLCLAALAQDPSTDAAATGPLAQLAGQSSDLRRLPDSGTVSYPLVVAAGTTLSARVLETRVDTGTIQGEPFAATIDPANATLELRASEGRPLSPGEYTVSLELRSQDGRVEPLSVRVVVPAAELRVVPNPAALEVVRSMSGRLSSPRAVAVRELGERSVSALQVGPEGNAVGAEGPLSTGLFGQAEPLKLPRGGEGEIALQVSEDVPLGTSSVNLELRAPELKGPLSIPVQLLVRRPRWLMLAAAFLGASMQLIQKVLLPRLNARVAEDSERKELRRVVERELAREDRALREVLKGIQAELPEPFQASKPSTWTSQADRLTQLRQRLSAASEAYNRRLATLAGHADELFSLVGRRFQLPAAARTLLGPADSHTPSGEPTVANHVEKAQELLRSGATDPAEALLSEADQDLQRVLNLCRSWADAVTRELGALDVPPARLPRPSAHPGAREALLTALGSNVIVGVSGVRDVAVVLDQLQAVHDAKRQSKTFVYDAALELRDTAGRARLPLSKDNRASFDKVFKPFAAGTSTETDVQALVACATSLQEAVLAALGAEVAKDKLALVAEGEYLEALGGGGPDTFSDTADSPEPTPHASEEVPAPETSATTLSEMSSPAEPPDGTARSLPAALIELVVSCLLLGALVWATYAESFVGTMEEMLAIFTFAYGANLGLDPLLGQLTGRVKPKVDASESSEQG